MAQLDDQCEQFMLSNLCQLELQNQKYTDVAVRNLAAVI